MRDSVGVANASLCFRPIAHLLQNRVPMSEEPTERKPRSKLEMLLLFRRESYPASRVEVVDISETGFLIDSAVDLAIGERVWLCVPGLQSLAAKVVRIDGFKIGCAFDQPMHEAVLRTKLDELSG